MIFFVRSRWFVTVAPPCPGRAGGANATVAANSSDGDAPAI